MNVEATQSDVGPLQSRLILALLVLIGCVLISTTWRQYINTWDEPEHLAAGLELIETGHYRYDIQHPPLARVVIAIGPWLLGAKSLGMDPPDGKPEGLAILYGEGHYWERLSAARAGTLPFYALLVVMTYACSRLVQSRRLSLIAAFLVATLPVLVGHAGLATIDIAATATLLAMLYAFWRYCMTPNVPTALWVGISSGVALGVKLSAIPFGFLGMVAMAWLERGGGGRSPLAWRHRVGHGALMAAMVGVILTLAYGGGFEYLTNSDHKFNQALFFLFGKKGWWHDVGYEAFSHFEVPIAFQWYLGGIQAISVHNQSGHLSYLLGQSRLTGWWYFYLVALLVKTPLTILVPGVVGVAQMLRRGIATACPRLLVLPVVGLLILAFASVYSNINIGVRHVFILYPVLCIAVAFCLNQTSQWLGHQRRSVQAVGVLVITGVLASPIWVLMREWPDYLPYFNGLVADPQQVLVDSDLDWGQDLARLSTRLAQLRVPEISIAYSGSAVMANEHLPPYRLLAPDQRAVGWVAVSALARVDAPHHFDWLKAYQPIETIGKTIDLYYIPSLH